MFANDVFLILHTYIFIHTYTSRLFISPSVGEHDSSHMYPFVKSKYHISRVILYMPRAARVRHVQAHGCEIKAPQLLQTFAAFASLCPHVARFFDKLLLIAYVCIVTGSRAVFVAS